LPKRHMRPRRGALAHILVLLLSVILSVVLFLGAALGVVFHCMYEKGGHMLAALLLSYDITEFVPGLYFSDEELDLIRATYLAPKDEDADEDDAEPTLALAEQPTAAPAEGADSNVSWTDGIAVVVAPTATPVPTPTPEPTEAPAPAEPTPEPTPEPLVNPMEYVLIGRVQSEQNVNLRSTASLQGETVATIAPGEWVRIVSEHGTFYKIIYQGRECYIFNTLLHVVKVPVESAGAAEE